ncbi:MAG: rod shape-determining protein MreC [Paracoccaceae bacterium]
MANTAANPDKAFTRIVNRILLGIVVAVSLVLLILWRTDNPRLERVRMSVVDTVAPSMEWVNGPVDFAWNLGRDYRSFMNLQDQNRRLRREIQSLRAWREQARLLEEENAQLRALNNVRLAARTTFVTGDVFADSGGPFLQAALVNVGREDGVADGAAAVDGSGLVGRVVGVGQRASRLMLLTDFSSRVPVIIQPGARRAVLSGDSTDAPKLEFLDGTDRVQPGDLIETSGDGGVFPPDLPIGRVVATQGGTWRAALLADYSRLEFVRLLRYNPDTVIDNPGDLVRPDGMSPAAQDPAPGGNSGPVATGEAPN